MSSLSLLHSALLSIALLGAAACQREAAPPKITKAITSCRDSLAGVWRAEGDARFRYRIRDEGQRVVLEPLFEAGGAGTAYGPFLITLARAGDGAMRGRTETTYSEKGKTCPLSFESRIERCEKESLVLASESDFDIRIETCEVHRSGVMTSATLRRESRDLPAK